MEWHILQNGMLSKYSQLSLFFCIMYFHPILSLSFFCWMRFCYLNSWNAQNDSLKWYLRFYYELTKSTSTLVLSSCWWYWGNMPTWKTHSSLSTACLCERELFFSFCLVFLALCRDKHFFFCFFFSTCKRWVELLSVLFRRNTSYNSVDNFKWKLQPQSDSTHKEHNQSLLSAIVVSHFIIAIAPFQTYKI